jgi:response regulator RpfG family c-di-GMP phosphodiesterase
VNTTRPRILCVDNEPMNLKLLEALLIPRGYEVIKALNGKEALSRIHENINLVLLDVMMPEMNGFEVCRLIKGNERYRNIPAVMITALRSKDDRIKGIEAGADDLISKPFDQGEVLARIKMLLKIKDLNDRLSLAYNNINSLISYGEEIIKKFDPLHFEFMSIIDNIIEKNIKISDDEIGKPEMIIIGFLDEMHNWQFRQYKSVSGILENNLLDLNSKNIQDLMPLNHTKISYYNKGNIQKTECSPFLKAFESTGITVSNTVCYLSNDLLFFALNYSRDVTSYDASVLNNLVMQSLFLRSLSNQVKETEDAFAYTVSALARASEVNDEDTGNHIIRVGEYSALLAKQLKMPDKFMSFIRVQAQMHDIGKIHTSPDILRKPGKLTPEEYEEIKKHTTYGAKILGDHLRFTMAREIALSHHERWDGSRYPYGLKWEQIPLTGRILNIADQYDALRNARVYKPAFDHQKTYHIITEGDGKIMPYHFDPQILQAFKETASQFEEIYERLKG